MVGQRMIKDLVHQKNMGAVFSLTKKGITTAPYFDPRIRRHGGLVRCFNPRPPNLSSHAKPIIIMSLVKKKKKKACRATQVT